MKRSNNLLEQLKSSPYFTKEEVLQLNSQDALKPTAINTFIARSLKRKNILSLKRGFYVTAEFYNKHKNDTSYSFFLANVLRKPSYVSSWTALQYYGLATEGIRTITSITPKVTRSYDAKIGSFSYASISDTLFDGFVLQKGTFDFYIATPAKALFDMLYFKTRRFRGLVSKQIPDLLEELRVDIDVMDTKEQKKFYALIQNYMHHG